MSGFNPWNEVRQFMKEVREFIAEQREFNAEQREFNAEQREFNAEVKAFMKEQREFNNTVDSNFEHLFAELSRFKNDSGKLMISVFAFCEINNLPFSLKTLAYMGKKATAYTNKHGYKIGKTQDPRFGFVNVYEREVLEQLFLTEGDNNE